MLATEQAAEAIQLYEEVLSRVEEVNLRSVALVGVAEAHLACARVNAAGRWVWQLVVMFIDQTHFPNNLY